jgi:hypothetical protein
MQPDDLSIVFALLQYGAVLGALLLGLAIGRWLASSERKEDERS